MPSEKLSVASINQELEGKPVKLALRGSKISLVATLPTKDGAGRRQQRIPLGLGEDQIELREARTRAYELFTQIVRGTFKWEHWDRRLADRATETAGETIARYQRERISQGLSPEIWYEYSIVLNRLPQDKPLTASEILKLAKSYKPDSCSRRKACTFLGGLARFAGIEVDLARIQGNYSAAKVKPRSLPTDEEIEQAWEAIAGINSRSSEVAVIRWVYGMMATYGLRNHEVMFCTIDPEPPYVCRVREGKTGDREAYPLPYEWVEKFNLLDIKRPTFRAEGRTHKQIGCAISRKLRRTLIKSEKYHQPYELRHAYALRGELRYGFGSRVMASYMGHSEKVHVETYKRWLSKESVRKAYLEKVKPSS